MPIARLPRIIREVRHDFFSGGAKPSQLPPRYPAFTPFTSLSPFDGANSKARQINSALRVPTGRKIEQSYIRRIVYHRLRNAAVIDAIWRYSHNDRVRRFLPIVEHGIWSRIVRVLTSVPLPIPINRLTTAREALADSHPARWMVAAGVVPVLETKGVRGLLSAIFRIGEEGIKSELDRDPVWKEVLPDATALKGCKLQREFLLRRMHPLRNGG